MKTPFSPYGMKPPPAVKLCGWNAVEMRTMTVRTGIAIFHHTIALFVSASQRTPITLMKLNSSIRAIATAYPCAVSTGVPPLTFVSPLM